MQNVWKYSPRVLVVDDDENIISAFEDFFRQEKCTMIPATSSSQALKIVERGGIDLLITDIRFRYQSGVTMFLRVKSIQKDLPVIVITGYPEAITEDEVKALGAECMLFKPLDLNRLRQSIKACLLSPAITQST
jgi:DNA-binding NtrC family response regulator